MAEKGTNRKKMDGEERIMVEGNGKRRERMGIGVHREIPGPRCCAQSTSMFAKSIMARALAAAAGVMMGA